MWQFYSTFTILHLNHMQTKCLLLHTSAERWIYFTISSTYLSHLFHFVVIKLPACGFKSWNNEVPSVLFLIDLCECEFDRVTPALKKTSDWPGSGLHSFIKECICVCICVRARMCVCGLLDGCGGSQGTSLPSCCFTRL